MGAVITLTTDFGLDNAYVAARIILTNANMSATLHDKVEKEVLRCKHTA